jgi:DNA-binding Lrp family transcriptional regulator
MTVAYDLLRELRCATVREVAERLGVAYVTAREYLERLVNKGLVEKKMTGRVAVYCVAKDVDVVQRGAYKLFTETRRRMRRVEELLSRNGCVSVSALMRELRINHNHAYHLLNVMLLMRRGVKMVVGNTAVLCRDRQAAEEVITQLRETVHRLAIENKVKYATATKMLRLVSNNRDTYMLFGKFIPSLRRGAERFPPVALAFMDAVLRSLYGEPAWRQHRRLVYIVTQPRPEHGIEIIDDIDGHVVYVNLPDDLAVTLKDTDTNQIVMQALEQLLARYRT